MNSLEANDLTSGAVADEQNRKRKRERESETVGEKSVCEGNVRQVEQEWSGHDGCRSDFYSKRQKWGKRGRRSNKMNQSASDVDIRRCSVRDARGSNRRWEKEKEIQYFWMLYLTHSFLSVQPHVYSCAVCGCTCRLLSVSEIGSKERGRQNADRREVLQHTAAGYSKKAAAAVESNHILDKIQRRAGKDDDAVDRRGRERERERESVDVLLVFTV